MSDYQNQEEGVNRCRMNFAQDAKGRVKMDLTVQAETPEETAEQAKKAVELYRQVCQARGLTLLEAGE